MTASTSSPTKNSLGLDPAVDRRPLAEYLRLPWSCGAPLKELWRAKRYSVCVVLCLGLGLGSTAAILATVDAYLVRPLPFKESDRLVSIWKIFRTDQNRGLRYFPAPREFEFLRRELETIAVAAQQSSDLDILGRGDPERVQGARVTGNLLSLLGGAPVAGRLIEPEDERMGRLVAVLDRGFAVRHFGSVQEALGEVLRVDGRPYEVVGVLPSDLGLPSGAEIWIPLTPIEYEGRLGFGVVGRLEPGRTLGEAVAEIRGLGARLVEVDATRNGSAGLDGDSLQTSLVGELRPMLLALLVAGLLLLSIACSNTAFLALARARKRAADFDLKEALGARPLHIWLGGLLENGLLAAGAVAFGLLTAALLLPLVPTMSPVEVFTFIPVRVDGRIAGYIAILAAGIAIVLTIAARWSGRGSGRAFLRDSRTIVAPRILSTLLVADVFLTTVLMVGVISMQETVGRLARIDSGLQAEGVTTLGVSASTAWAGSHERRVEFFDRLVAEVGALPGVGAVAAVNSLPMSAAEFSWGINIEELPPADPASTESVLFRMVTSDYFRALGIPLLNGRVFTRLDGAAAPRVAVCNRAFARRYFPGREVVGARIKGGRYDAEGEWTRIVGVTEDVRERGLAQPVVPALFIPMAQWDRPYLSRMRLVVRSTSEMNAIIGGLRQRLRSIDPNAVIFDVEPMTIVVSRTLRRHRFALSLTAAFALLAAVQATLGIYAMVVFDTGSRLREIGVRLALGAQPEEVRRWVVGRALARGAIGLGPGLLVSFGLLWWGHRQWGELEPTAPLTYLGLGVLSTLAVATAAYFPARRAGAIDPARTLREG